MRSVRLLSLLPGTVALVLVSVVPALRGEDGKPPAARPSPQPAKIYPDGSFDAKEAAGRQDETARALGVEKELTIRLDANVSMKLTLIPAGRFMMGSPDDEPNRYADEGPRHEVTISQPFYMGTYEVTQEQYSRVMGNNPSGFAGATCPVERVSWHDAAEFCARLSRQTGLTVRLPTEAQWEYACRAGTTIPLDAGGTMASRPGNYGATRDSGGQAGAQDSDKTVAVGSFKPNAFGLYDMQGNVWEWCGDWYDAGCYADSPRSDPQGPASGAVRVLRGGSWFNGPRLCRPAARFWYAPDMSYSTIGFRVVALPSPAATGVGLAGPPVRPGPAPAQPAASLPSGQPQAPSVSGTTWAGPDSDGDYYEYHFQPDGSLHWKSPSGYWKNGSWKQDGSSIYMEMNKKYVEKQGAIKGEAMEGSAWTVKGSRWTWAAKKQ